MSSKSFRRGVPARPPRSVRLRCERFEDRITPANMFNVQTAYSLGGLNNGFVGVTDLNHDGYLDAIMTDEGLDFGLSSGNKLTVLKGGPGSGGSAVGFSATQYNTGGTNVSFAAIADINGDGFDDVVATNENNHNPGTLSVFQNDGFGHLLLVGTPIQTQSRNPCWCGLADVTGDGVLDVVVASFGNDDGTNSNVTGNGITIFQGGVDGTGHGTFNFTYINTVRPAVQFIPTALAIADFDGDGLKDIAAAYPGVPADSSSPQPNGFVDLFRGTGLGAFTEVANIDCGGALPVNIQAADINGDGKKDLVIANAGDPNSSSPYWAGTSIGVLTNFSQPGNVIFDGPTSLYANAYGAFAVAIADYNLDGKQDIASINFGDIGSSLGGVPSTVAVYLGAGNGTFSSPVVPTPATYVVDNSQGAAGGQYLAVGDFDRNGTPDLVVAMAANHVGLLLNAATPPPKVAGVQVNDGSSAQRSEVKSIAVTFSGPVNFAGGNGNAASAFTLTRVTGAGGTVGLAASVATVGLQTVVTLTFTGTTATDALSAQNGGALSLADGRFQLTINAGAITGSTGLTLDGDGNGSAGGNYVSPTDTAAGGTGQLRLFRLFGDADGNGTADLVDLSLMRSAFNTGIGGPGYLSYLDADNSGTVDLVDLGQFRSRFNATVF